MRSAERTENFAALPRRRLYQEILNPNLVLARISMKQTEFFMIQDIEFALRQFFKPPGLTIAAVRCG